ncbi:hypothetical protein [Hellea balneolensis]|uniref:hypothetical protein n=1 Tax=Hellea balneolensis TaxID=287478 RepID=UPI000418E09E|nr:hypothetical protein [Hellea balneolensis]
MGDAPQYRDITRTLEAILADKIFSASPKAQDFLRYIVTESLEGRADALNGTTIAQDVFGKNADFDPMQDSVVRVTARRLRYMLQDYYAQKNDPSDILITIPKGGYRPQFDSPIPISASKPVTPSPAQNGTVETVTLPADVSTTRNNWFSYWPLGAGLLALIFAAVFALRSFTPLQPNIQSEPLQARTEPAPKTLSEAATSEYSHLISSYPSIAVMRFTNQTDDPAFDFLEQALQTQMTEDLTRFSLIRPIAHEENYETLLRAVPQNYDYAITGVILGVEPEIDIYIKLIDLGKTEIIYENRLRRAPGQSQYYRALYDMVSDLSGDFAGLEGVIIKKRLGSIQKKIAADTNEIANLEAFECHSLVGTLMQSPSPELYKTIYNCLETSLKDTPENSTLLASFGWITYVGAISHEPVLKARSVNPDIDDKVGIKMIEEAIRINPDNSWAQQALSLLKIRSGDIPGGLMHAEMAVLENPANPDNLTWLSLCLAHSGKWDRAMQFAQEALDRNPEAPSQYYYTFYMKALEDGDGEAMIKVATELTERENYYAPVYSYLAALASGDEPLKSKVKPEIDAMAARNGNDIMNVIKVLMPSDALQGKAEQLLIDAGEAAPPVID